MTLKGIRRCLAISTLAFAGLTFAGCSTTAESKHYKPKPGDKDYGKALLYVDHAFLGANRVYAYPDPIVISNYGENPKQTVTWYFIHKKTQIVFGVKSIDDKLTCKEGPGTWECTLELPTGLLPDAGSEKDKKKFKYTIKGEDGNGPLSDHDPEVEIDR